MKLSYISSFIAGALLSTSCLAVSGVGPDTVSGVGPDTMPDPASLHHHSSRHVERREHNKFSIAFNVPTVVTRPATSTTVVTTTEYVKPHHRHRNRLEWVTMNTGDPLPANAVVGGSQSYPAATLYVCQANYRGGMHPGKLYDGHCNIGWGGSEVSLSSYNVLVGRGSLAWAPASDGNVPANAIEGGYQQDGPLYVCQANYRGGMHPGKIVGQNCNIGWGGAEVLIPDYNVLVA